MAKTVEMFDKPPRKSPRVMMIVVNAGNHWQGGRGIEFECRKCAHNTGYIVDTRTVTENKRGMPCPVCNEPKEDNKDG